MADLPLSTQRAVIEMTVCTECGHRIFGTGLCSYECPLDNTSTDDREAPATYVSLSALVGIAREMYEGMEVGSPEQLAVSEFLGRAESL